MTTTISLAETNQSKNQIVISIGQQIELPIKSMSSYSIGNKDLLSARYLESRKLLLIKGKKQGFSDLIVWHNAKQKSQYRIFVLSKKDQLKTIQIHKLLKENNLIPRQISGQIHVDGKIKSREAYRIIIALQSLLKEKFINHTTLNRTVAKKIITESYLFFEQLNLEDYSCDFGRETFIHCKIEDQLEKSQMNILKDFANLEGITLIFPTSFKKKNNYRLSLKLIQLNHVEGEEFGLGLNQLITNPIELFQQNVLSILNRNTSILSGHNIEAKVLAEPQMLITLDSNAIIRLGKDIPYQSQNNHQTVLQWQFAGLEIDAKLTLRQNQYFIEYKTSIKAPIGMIVEGSEQHSMAYIQLNKAVELFQIGFNVKNTEKKQIPILGDIPILGKLFENNSSSSTFKKISGFMYLERI